MVERTGVTTCLLSGNICVFNGATMKPSPPLLAPIGDNLAAFIVSTKVDVSLSRIVCPFRLPSSVLWRCVIWLACKLPFPLDFRRSLFFLRGQLEDKKKMDL